MAKFNSPILWFEGTFCSKCTDKTCSKRNSAGGIYKTSDDNKIPCLLCLILMSEIDDFGLVKTYKQ
jgi:hypothetical protein